MATTEAIISDPKNHVLYFVIFKLLSIERTSEKKNNLGLVYFIVSLIILEWFLKHPAMRYGGYVLIAIPFFIYFSNKLSCYKFHFQKTNICQNSS